MNFAALDLNLLRVLDALMRERSVTRAGERIGLSQPAVSNALTRLRKILGDELFVGRGTDMLPPPRAEAIGAILRTTLTQMEEALSVFGHLLFHLFAECRRNRSQRKIAHTRHPLSLANQAA
jgi:DNA-binding transcriptional LysR family regulator